MLKNMKIGTKLAAGFAAVLVIFSAAGWFAWRNMDSVISEVGTLEQRYVPGIELSNEIENIAQNLMLHIRTYVLADSFQDLQAAQGDFEAIDGVLKRAGSMPRPPGAGTACRRGEEVGGAGCRIPEAA